MQSPAELARERRINARFIFRVWNRKAHYYLGLYFLFFLWLFAFTGLLLNHSWKFAEFWPNRTVSKFERSVRVEGQAGDLDRAHAVMRQLGIEGEVEWTAGQTDGMIFSFPVARPGRTSQVTVNAELNRATVEQTDINAWGIMRVLHTFTGVRSGDERNNRDWVLNDSMGSLDGCCRGRTCPDGVQRPLSLDRTTDKAKAGSRRLACRDDYVRCVCLRSAVDLLTLCWASSHR
jgi:hypothetical protein